MKKFKIVHSDEKIPSHVSGGNSLFLAGPTSRSSARTRWRLDAVDVLTSCNEVFDVVFVPERTSWMDNFKYEDQIEWEHAAMDMSTTVLFWVPRSMEDLPGLTTNVEFGWCMARMPRKIIYGRPDGAHSTRYLDYLYRKSKYGMVEFNNLEKMIRFVAGNQKPVG